jgi:hypothetical protein
MLLSLVSMSITPAQNHPVTDAEARDARELATQFITEFAQANDLMPVVKDLYVADFIQRFNNAKLKHPDDSSFDLYFMPGLQYDHKLLAQGSPDDWLQFYSAENTLLFLGIRAVSKNISSKNEDISPTAIFPRRVIDLLNKNPNLSNVAVRKGPAKPIVSIDELRKATETLQKAAAVMRENIGSKVIDKKELANQMGDELFKPEGDFTGDEEFFGLPKNTKIITMRTPILFYLVLMRQDKRLKILCAIPYSA